MAATLWGIEAGELKLIKEPEEENRHLKKMLDNVSKELDLAKYIIEKKALKPCEKRRSPQIQLKDHRKQIY